MTPLAFFIAFLAFTFNVTDKPSQITPLSIDNKSLDDTYFIRTWTMDDGLPVNSVNDIQQCEAGYIWLSTYDGIVRFDGLNFKIFNTSNTPTLKNNRFFYIKKAQDGSLWFINEFTGVVRYFNGIFTHFDSSNGFTDGSVSYFFEHDEAQYFTTTNGVFKFQNDSFTQIIRRNTVSQNHFTSGLVANNGSLFFSSHDGIVELTIDNQILIYNNPDSENNVYLDISLFNNEIFTITNNKLYLFSLDGEFQEILYSNETHDILWSTSNHLILSAFSASYLIDDKFNVKSYTLSDNSSNHLRRRFNISVFEDEEELHFLRLDGKWIVYNDESLHVVDIEIIENLSISTIFRDKTGTLWLSSANVGLHQLLKKHISTISSEDGLEGNNVLGIYKDSKNNIWAGTRLRGINKITPDGEFIYFRDDANGANLNDIYSIAETSTGEIWIANNAPINISKLTNDGFVNIHFDELLPSRVIRAISMNSDDTMWVAGNGILILYDTRTYKKLRVFSTADGVPESLIRKIVPISNSSFWAATATAGVFHFENGVFTRYTTSDGLGSNSVRGIYIDRADNETVWFATEGNGITRFKNGEMRVLNTSHGLFEDLLHNITEDHFGRLWMSTNRGIFYIYKESANRVLDGEAPFLNSIFFNNRHGMINAEANGGFQNSFILDGHTLYYSTQFGIAVIQTDKIDIDVQIPRVRIETISSDSNFIDPNIESVVFDKGTRDLMINFTAFDFVNPERITFRYKLEGYDRNWKDAGTQRSVSYTNLPPKTYTFKVKATNINHSFSDDYITASITLLPYFYQQTWFYFLSGFMVITLIVMIHKYRVRYMETKELELVKLVEKRTKDILKQKEKLVERQKTIEEQKIQLELANNTKDAFFSIIAHDLKGPIGGIHGLSKIILEEFDESEKEEIREYLNIIADSSGGTLKLLSNLLDWARIQSGRMHTNFEVLDTEKIVLNVLESQISVINHKKIQLILNLGQDLDIFADKNLMETVLRNLISNAIKFSYYGKSLSISSFEQNERVCFKIKDEGMGMSKSDIDNALRIDRSFSKRGTMNEVGSGLGLTLCINMINLMNGEIQIDSELGKGTSIIISIPTAREKTTLVEFKK